MKKIFLAASAFVALIAGPAGAADMAVKYRPAPVVPLCANFGGFYLGAHAGGARYTNNWQDRDDWGGQLGNLLLADHERDSTNTKTGFVGGLTGGYNWQAKCTVFGFEADYSWSRITAEGVHNSTSIFQLFGLGPDSIAVSSSLRGFGTLRTRAGVVVDNLLIYVTGGLAVARFDRSQSIGFSLNPVLAAVGISGDETFNSRDTRWGWAVGVGTEWAAWDNWSIKSEFLHLGFEKTETVFNSRVGAPIGILTNGPKLFENQDSIWVSRIGINYRFNYAPVVARY